MVSKLDVQLVGVDCHIFIYLLSIYDINTITIYLYIISIYVSLFIALIILLIFCSIIYVFVIVCNEI